jgi:hypothetical protein
VIGSQRKDFNPKFEEQVKVQILASTDHAEVRGQAGLFLQTFTSRLDSEQVREFELVRFIQEHGKETLDQFARLSCQFIAKYKALLEPLFQKITAAAEHLYLKKFD